MAHHFFDPHDYRFPRTSHRAFLAIMLLFGGLAETPRLTAQGPPPSIGTGSGLAPSQEASEAYYTLRFAPPEEIRPLLRGETRDVRHPGDDRHRSVDPATRRRGAPGRAGNGRPHRSRIGGGVVAPAAGTRNGNASDAVRRIRRYAGSLVRDASFRSRTRRHAPTSSVRSRPGLALGTTPSGPIRRGSAGEPRIHADPGKSAGFRAAGEATDGRGGDRATGCCPRDRQRHDGIPRTGSLGRDDLRRLGNPLRREGILPAGFLARFGRAGRFLRIDPNPLSAEARLARSHSGNDDRAFGR